MKIDNCIVGNQFAKSISYDENAFISTEIYHTLSHTKEPLILRGFVSAWPAVQAAKLSNDALVDYLKAFAVDQPTFVFLSEEYEKIGYLEDFSGFTFEPAQSTIPRVLDLLKQGIGKTLYLGSISVDKWFPEFRKKNDVVFPPGVRPIVNCWIGNKNQISAHYDVPRNIACCVAGKRTFTLFPPDQIENLYVGPIDVTPSGRAISLVDFEKPDFQKHPKFRDALDSAVKIDLEPGDAIYIPSLWWHHVRSHSNLNILINYWWRSLPVHHGYPDLVLDHAILSLRGLPEHELKWWKCLFEYYVFGEISKTIDHIPSNLRGALDPSDENSIRRAWLEFAKKMNR